MVRHPQLAWMSAGDLIGRTMTHVCNLRMTMYHHECGRFTRTSSAANASPLRMTRKQSDYLGIDLFARPLGTLVLAGIVQSLKLASFSKSPSVLALQVLSTKLSVVELPILSSTLVTQGEAILYSLLPSILYVPAMELHRQNRLAW